MFLLNSIKFKQFNFIRHGKILRSFQLSSQDNLSKSSIFKEPVDANVDSILNDIQRNSLIKLKRSKPKYKYSRREVQILYKAVLEHGPAWDLISEKYFSSTRTASSLSTKWSNLIQPDQDDMLPLDFYIRNYTDKWTKEEDKILFEKVQEYGVGNWTQISKYLPKKSARQVNYRYCILSPSKKGKWTKEEDVNLLFLVEKFGKNWSVFSEILQRPFHTLVYRYTYLTNPPEHWTHEENIRLNKAIMNYGENWGEILKLFPNRKLKDIKSHYRTNSRLHPFVNSGKWDDSEIKKFKIAFEKFERNWEEVAKFIQTRTPVQCYTHWKYNYGRLFNRKAANLNLLE